VRPTAPLGILGSRKVFDLWIVSMEAALLVLLLVLVGICKKSIAERLDTYVSILILLQIPALASSRTH
jgi:hypothetical protein